MCHQTSSLCLCFRKLISGLAFIVLLNVPLLGEAPADATKKVVVADSASLEKSTKVVNDLYGDDFKKAITPAMKSALAQKLLQEGETEKSDMAAKYVLLKDAAEQAAAGGDITTVDAAIFDLANTFQFDPSKITGELTRQAWKALPPSADRVEFSQRLESMSDRALQDDHYDLAVNLDDLAMTASRQSGNNQLVAEVRDRSQRTSEIKAAFIRAQPMIAKLAAAPDDGQANLAVGQFRCFYKGDWDRGLPMLAKGSDAGLATLATADLKTPAVAQDQLVIGDQWWDRGKTQKGVAQENCEGRACYWYGISEPSLSGLEKARIDKRLQTTAALKISRQITVDLIRLVDTNRDAVSGTWEQKNHTLKSDGGDFTRIEFPFDLPEEYDYKVEFERVGGGDCVYVLAAVHNQPFAFILGGMGNHHYGLTGPNEMSTDSVLTNGKRYVCLIKVRRQLISVFLDGKLIQQANAKELQANPNLALRHKNAVGLCTYESPAIFHKAELTQVTGMGHSLETANTR